MRVFKNIGESPLRLVSGIIEPEEVFEPTEKEISMMEREQWIGIRVEEVSPEDGYVPEHLDFAAADSEFVAEMSPATAQALEGALADGLTDEAPEHSTVAVSTLEVKPDVQVSVTPAPLTPETPKVVATPAVEKKRTRRR